MFEENLVLFFLDSLLRKILAQLLSAYQAQIYYSIYLI